MWYYCIICYSHITLFLLKKYEFDLFYLMLVSGADPVFPVGGGANPREGARQHTILPNFVKKCMKLRKFWAVGGLAVGAPKFAIGY